MANTMVYMNWLEDSGGLSRSANQTPKRNVNNRRIHNTFEHVIPAVIQDTRIA